MSSTPHRRHRRSGRLGLAVLSLAGLVVSCGSQQPAARSAPPSRPTRARPTATPRPASPLGACSKLRKTTPLAQAPSTCAALWNGYGFTQVPPNNLMSTLHVPEAPTVNDQTNGAISQTEAQLWANAMEDSNGWQFWADVTGQAVVLNRLETPQAQSPAEIQAMQEGATFSEPAACLFPQSISLVPMTSAGQQFFVSLLQPTAAQYVFITTFANCVTTIQSASASPAPLYSYNGSNNTTLQAGSFAQDPLLGPLWVTSALGDCADINGHPPSQWCSN